MKLSVGKGPYCAAVVPAAGCSERMEGQDKIFLELLGKPVLVWTLEALAACPMVREIVVAVREDKMQAAAEMLHDYDIGKLTFVMAGGEERRDSVAAAVAAVSKKAKYIVVHDGARPLVTPDIIEKTVHAAVACKAAACAVPVKDTIKIAEHDIVQETPERKKLFAVQTPQVFDAALLRCALENAQEKNLPVTDDCMAIEALGGMVMLSPGSYENIKITTPTDLLVAEAILKGREA